MQEYASSSVGIWIYLPGGHIGLRAFWRKFRRELLVTQLLAEELLAAFATGYHEDTEQDEDSRGYFGECELILAHHDSQHGGNDGDSVVVDADDGRAQASLCEEQQEVGDEGGAHDDEG